MHIYIYVEACRTFVVMQINKPIINISAFVDIKKLRVITIIVRIQHESLYDFSLIIFFLFFLANSRLKPSTMCEVILHADSLITLALNLQVTCFVCLLTLYVMAIKLTLEVSLSVLEQFRTLADVSYVIY